MHRIFALTAAALLSVAVVAVAVAHAEPARVTPGDAAVLNKAPNEVVIEMSQDMARQDGANDIDVTDASGKEVTTVAAVIDNSDRRKLSVALPSTLAPGKYTVNWKTVSADDGDAANGSLSFMIDPGGTPTPGKEILQEDLLGGSPTAAPAQSGVPGGGGGGTSWVLVSAVALGAFVVGAGATFLLVQKQP